MGKIMTITRASNRALQEMDYDEWCHHLDLLIEDSEESQWAIGDAWNARPDLKATAEKRNHQFKMSPRLLTRLGQVAASFPEARRRALLTHSHHRELTSLSRFPKEQDKLLEQAEINKWTQKELRRQAWQVKLDLGLVQPKFEKAKLVPPMPKERDLTPPQFLEKTLSEISKYLNPDRDKKVVDMVNLVLSFKDDDLHPTTRKDAAKTVRRVAQRFLDLASRLDPEDQQQRNEPLLLERLK